jgi:hypothetical protein
MGLTMLKPNAGLLRGFNDQTRSIMETFEKIIYQVGVLG